MANIGSYLGLAVAGLSVLAIRQWYKYKAMKGGKVYNVRDRDEYFRDRSGKGNDFGRGSSGDNRKPESDLSVNQGVGRKNKFILRKSGGSK